jgi:23S rRNA pseudouridine2605 synthase
LVKVGEQKVFTPSTRVLPSDEVRVNGAPLPSIERPRLWIHHKKRGVLVTHASQEESFNRATLFPTLRKMGLPHLISAGRLDFRSEGLLLLTNNGELARFLEHPDNAFAREYHVRVHGNVTARLLETLRRGIRANNVTYRPMGAERLRSNRYDPAGATHWLVMRLFEGKNREIRKTLEKLGVHVSRLIRHRYGPFHLNSLPSGAVQEVDLKLLWDQ